MPFTFGVAVVTIGIGLLTINGLIYNQIKKHDNKDYRKQRYDETVEWTKKHKEFINSEEFKRIQRQGKFFDEL